MKKDCMECGSQVYAAGDPLVAMKRLEKAFRTKIGQNGQKRGMLKAESSIQKIDIIGRKSDV